MASGPITSCQLDGKTMETVRDFIFLGSKITADGDCSHEIKRRFLLERKAMTNLDSILKSRDITLLTKVHLVKAMVFPVIMYGCAKYLLSGSQPRNETRVSCIAGGFFTNWAIREAPKWKWKLLSCAWLFATPWTTSPWNSPGQNIGVGSLSLLQGILPTQGLNPGIPHCRWILYQLSHKGGPD